MECDFCGEDIEDKGMLITVRPAAKKWSCSDCFIIHYIKDNASILHHWGYIEKEADALPGPEPE